MEHLWSLLTIPELAFRSDPTFFDGDSGISETESTIDMESNLISINKKEARWCHQYPVYADAFTLEEFPCSNRSVLLTVQGI